jgi:starch synthase
VSRTHADELRTAVGGFGLHEMFQGLGDRFQGILNGIDQERWDPATDRMITARYTADDLSGKRRCKAALQRRVGLPQRARTPLLAVTARLVPQKGLDLMLHDPRLAEASFQFVVLGDGEPRYRDALLALREAHPDRVAVDFDFNDRMEHRLLAGADLLIMPSLYEPCGLTQMRAQRYGAIPVARRVGGLADTIVEGETGFLFERYHPDALWDVLGRALERYDDVAGWEAMMARAMHRDFGWTNSAAEYLAAYRRALAVHQPVS